MDQDIATAPGDLPLEMVVKRSITAKRQFRHDGQLVPNSPGPKDRVLIVAHAGAMLPVQSAFLRFRAYTPDSETEGVVEMTRRPVEHHTLAEYVRPWHGEIPAFADGTRVSYSIDGLLTDGTTIACQDGHGLWFNYKPSLSSTAFGYLVREQAGIPDWLRGSTIYQIFVDRFADKNGEQLRGTSLRDPIGGNLAGITTRLPYLDELGIGCLWLSPIGPAPSYHRYDATDYFSVDPRLGTYDDLVALTTRAHELGMRVILDFVPSHMSSNHPFFLEALQNEQSPRKDWFVFYEWPHSYRSFLEMSPTMPSIRTNSREARDYLIQSAVYWIGAGIDGIRLDHAIGHGSDFWAAFQHELTKIRPDVVTIAEATDTGDALRRYGSTLTAILDFPLARALRSTFAADAWDVASFESFLSAYEEYMEDAPGRASFLDNHDMDRFLHVAEQRSDRLALAALCILTLSQPPVIYYGTEVGMSHDHPISDTTGEGDALARQPMQWNQKSWNRELHAFFTKLIRLRSVSPALHSGSRQTIVADSLTSFFAYSKTAVNVDDNGHQSTRPFVVAINLGEHNQDIELEHSYLSLLGFPATAFTERDISHRFTLPGGSGLLLQRE